MMKVLPVATLARWVGPDSASALVGPPAAALVSGMIDEHRRRDDFSLFNAEGRAGLVLIGSHPPPVVVAPLVAWCAGEFRAGRSVFSNAGLLFGYALDPLVDPVSLLDDLPPGAVLLIECGERDAAGADDLALRAAAVAHHSDVLVIALADAHSAALSEAALPFLERAGLRRGSGIVPARRGPFSALSPPCVRPGCPLWSIDAPGWPDAHRPFGLAAGRLLRWPARPAGRLARCPTLPRLRRRMRPRT